MTTTSMKRNGSSHGCVSSLISMESLRELAVAVEMDGPKGILKSPGNSEPRRRSISFETVQIREYKRDICDNPSVTCGPPIGIDWEVKDESFVPLEIYETYRPERLDFYDLILERDEREYLILQSGRTKMDIASAVRDVQKAKHARRTSVNNIGTAAIVEEMMESAVRKLKRSFTHHKEDPALAVDFRTLDKMRQEVREELRQQEAMSSKSPSVATSTVTADTSLVQDTDVDVTESEPLSLPKIGRAVSPHRHLVRPVPVARSVSPDTMEGSLHSGRGSSPVVYDLGSLKKAPIRLCSDRSVDEE